MADPSCPPIGRRLEEAAVLMVPNTFVKSITIFRNSFVLKHYICACDMNTGEYYNQQEVDKERQAIKRRNRGIDLGVNWVVFVVLSLTGFWILLADIDTYQSERLFFRMLNDGVSIQETDPYMAKGMTRNLQFKGVSNFAFFVAKWKWRVPVYILLILVPVLIAGYRAWKYHRVQITWVYVFTSVLSFAYFVYFWGRMRGKW